jgi:clan AA aspartic protease (TIGR02281 family)
MSQALIFLASLATVFSGTALLSAHDEGPLNSGEVARQVDAANAPTSKARFQSSKRGFYIAGEVKGKSVTLMIDTGASLSVLTPSDAQALGVLRTSSKMVAGIGGAVSAGTAKIDLKVAGRTINNLEVAIIDTAPYSLLGMDAIHRLGTPELVLR